MLSTFTGDSVAPFPSRIDPETLGATALAVAEREGWDRWTLRSIAEDFGVTPNALYRHVGDRAGLVVAMGEAAAQQLSALLRRRARASLRKHEDPELAVLAIARAFIEFAAKRPDAYAAFMHAKPELEHPAHAAWIELWAQVHAYVREAVPDAADAAGFALWAFLHGRVALARGAASRAAVDAGLEDAVRALLTGFRANSPVPSPLPDHVRMDAAD